MIVYFDDFAAVLQPKALEIFFPFSVRDDHEKYTRLNGILRRELQ